MIFLSELNFGLCNVFFFLIFAGLITLGKNCKKLIHVDVAWCSKITDEGVVRFSELCLTLQYLCLTRCDQVNDSTTLELCDKYPHVKYSTLYLDCQRLIAKAAEQGFVTPKMERL